MTDKNRQNEVELGRQAAKELLLVSKGLKELEASAIEALVELPVDDQPNRMIAISTVRIARRLRRSLDVLMTSGEAAFALLQKDTENDE